MASKLKIKRGLDIPLQGAPEKDVTQDNLTRLFAICPDDYPGYKWKLLVKPEDEVMIGSPLLCDKATGEINIVSPVSGIVKEVHRGERRKIEFISIEKNDAELSVDLSEIINHLLDSGTKSDDKRASLHRLLLSSGMWALIRQRPFDVVADTRKTPRDIYISAFDSAPLAADHFTEDDRIDLEKGIELLSLMTDGKVFIGTRGEQNIKSDFADVIEVDGPHPAGNIGVLIANTKPVNKSETVWTLDKETAMRLGRMIKNRHIDFTTFTAVTGSEIKNPHIVRTHAGASLKTLIDGMMSKPADELRVISGNVLTGIKENPEKGWLRFPWRQVTVIPEGSDRDEFMGWASMNMEKFSVKRTFPSFFRKNHRFPFDARIKGGHRAMIMSGEYDKVFPFDIYPEYLIKAILNQDIDKMEKLGIYEVAPEDFALPEFVDTSKLELQKIVRQGLDFIKAETED